MKTLTFVIIIVVVLLAFTRAGELLPAEIDSGVGGVVDASDTGGNTLSTGGGGNPTLEEVLDEPNEETIWLYPEQQIALQDSFDEFLVNTNTATAQALWQNTWDYIFLSSKGLLVRMQLVEP